MRAMRVECDTTGLGIRSPGYDFAGIYLQGSCLDEDAIGTVRDGGHGRESCSFCPIIQLVAETRNVLLILTCHGETAPET